MIEYYIVELKVFVIWVIILGLWDYIDKATGGKMAFYKVEGWEFLIASLILTCLKKDKL